MRNHYRGLKKSGNILRLYWREKEKDIDFGGSFKNGLEEEEGLSSER